MYFDLILGSGLSQRLLIDTKLHPMKVQYYLLPRDLLLLYCGIKSYMILVLRYT